MFNSISRKAKTSTFGGSLTNGRQVLAAAYLNADADKRRDMQNKLMVAKNFTAW